MKWKTGDTCAVVGMLAISGGVAWLCLPAGLIVLGILLVVSGVIYQTAKAREEREESDIRRGR